MTQDDLILGRTYLLSSGPINIFGLVVNLLDSLSRISIMITFLISCVVILVPWNLRRMVNLLSLSSEVDLSAGYAGRIAVVLFCLIGLYIT
ncbi:hypothetical protein BD769DRAFT_1416974 [Suillus cothurnatus]|nr:hypothetical protein BD769DRAFT_1416974 [Suillus cothurnatus]